MNEIKNLKRIIKNLKISRSMLKRYIKKLKKLGNYKMRNEQEVLKDFEELGYEVIDTKSFLEMTDYNSDDTIHIDIKEKNYSKYNGDYYPMDFTLQEHTLLTELFTIWRWL